MARKNSEVNPLVKQLIEENKIKSANDAQDFMKNMFKDMVNILMQAEFDESIGYDKYDRESSTNIKIGYNSKQVNTSFRKVQVDIPRDREGQFEPTVVPKYSRDISDIKDKIISMYRCGMTISGINAHLEKIYGLTFSASQISKITDRVFIIGKIDHYKNAILLYSRVQYILILKVIGKFQIELHMLF